MSFALVLKKTSWYRRRYSRPLRVKAAVRNFFWLKMIRNQNLSKYITSKCSKLSPYSSTEMRDPPPPFTRLQLKFSFFVQG